MSGWKRRLEPIVRPLLFAWARLTRGKTLGVRAVVLDAEGRVALVRHTYTAGWWLPGGGVDAAETCEAAIARELEEEAGVRLMGRPRMLSVHSNDPRFRGDHVLLYLVEANGWAPCESASDGEIAEVGWFAPDALPADTTPGTRARLAEALGGETSDAYW